MTSKTSSKRLLDLKLLSGAPPAFTTEHRERFERIFFGSDPVWFVHPKDPVILIRSFMTDTSLQARRPKAGQPNAMSTVLPFGPPFASYLCVCGQTDWREHTLS